VGALDLGLDTAGDLAALARERHLFLVVLGQDREQARRGGLVELELVDDPEGA